MRTIWRGVLTLGLVQVPVGLVVAQERRPVGFRRVSRTSGAPVRHRRWDPVEDRPLTREETVPAYEVAPGEFVEVEEHEIAALRDPGRRETLRITAPAADPYAELDSAAGREPVAPPPPGVRDAGEDAEPEPEAASPGAAEVRLQGFLGVDEVEPLLLERAYWLTPGRMGERAYATLVGALERAGAGALGRMVLARRERLVLVRPLRGTLVLHTLLYPEDVREGPAEEIARRVAAHPAPGPDEAELADRLVAAIRTRVDPEIHRDLARVRIRALVAERARERGRPVPSGAPAEEGSAADALIAALRASLEEAGRG